MSRPTPCSAFDAEHLLERVDHLDEIQSARVLSLMMLVMGAAPILAPLGGGWLLVHGSWHWIFGFLAAFAALCFALVAGLLEE